ncbi:MAG: peroxiredoxin family protein [Candidatus Helarchaeota archaeon]
MKQLNQDSELRTRLKIIFISPDPPHKNKWLKKKLDASNVTILSDFKPKLEVIKLYGVLDTKSPTARFLHGIKETAKPATLIIDENKKIIYKNIGKNYMQRPKIKELLEALSS